MEDKKGSMSIWIWIVVIVVVVGGLIIWSMRSSTPAPMSTTDTGDNSQTALTPTETEDTTAGSVDTGSAVSISYADALVKYANARLQIDDTCQASPTQMTFKNGSFLMIDNRSSVEQSVKVGSTFNIKGYGFKIVQLSSATLPATWMVDCGTAQNVSTILIQK